MFLPKKKIPFTFTKDQKHKIIFSNERSSVKINVKEKENKTQAESGECQHKCTCSIKTGQFQSLWPNSTIKELKRKFQLHNSEIATKGCSIQFAISLWFQPNHPKQIYQL